MRRCALCKQKKQVSELTCPGKQTKDYFCRDKEDCREAMLEHFRST